MLFSGGAHVAGVTFRSEENIFVDSLWSLIAFVGVMAILFAVPDSRKSVARAATELRPAA
jgi:hypothetical protein